MNASIKAIICESPHHIAMGKAVMPLRREGEVLLRIARVGICGTDYHIYEGLHPFLEYPRVMGHELSGLVMEADATSHFTKNQLVVVNPYIACGTCHACVNGKPNCCMKIQVLGVHRDGGMCEFLVVPEKNLLPADGLSADAAACVEFLAIGAHAVRRSGMNSGQRVLVIGAGPIGLGVALFAQIAKADVTIMDIHEGRLALASAISGISSTILAGESANSAMDQNGFDVVFDATGNRQSMENSFRFASHGGTYVLVGLVKDNITFFDPDFHKREMTLMASRNATKQDFEHVIYAIKTNRIQISKLITHRTKLSDVVTNLPNWAKNKDGLIKAMIDLD
jgi:2-desacetyl-2-hydroxyethyl bacteriochlorophyllide A dehydrogenase